MFQKLFRKFKRAAEGAELSVAKLEECFDAEVSQVSLVLDSDDMLALQPLLSQYAVG